MSWLIDIFHRVRAAFLKTFGHDIQSYYDSIERNEAQPGKDLSEAEIRQLIRDTVSNALQMEDDSILKNDTDFFSLGLDPLMAISIRRKLGQEIETDGKVLNSNIVFENSNVNALTHYSFSLRSSAVERSAQQKTSCRI